jgi:hypothetical protein
MAEALLNPDTEEALLNPDTVKRTRLDSPPKVREESQKTAKNQYHQMLMIKDQRLSEVSQKEMIEDLKTRLFNSEKKQSILEKIVLDQMKSFQEKILDIEKKNLKWENTVLDYKKKTSQLESIGPVVQQTITDLPVKNNHSLESTSINHPEKIGISSEINTHCSTGREDSGPSTSSFQGESRFPCKTNIIQDERRRRGIGIEGRIR